MEILTPKNLSGVFTGEYGYVRSSSRVRLISRVRPIYWKSTVWRCLSLYISQNKRKCGLDVGQNYNLSKREDAKVPQCPLEKEAAIMEKPIWLVVWKDVRTGNIKQIIQGINWAMFPPDCQEAWKNDVFFLLLQNPMSNHNADLCQFSQNIAWNPPGNQSSR